MAEAMVGNRVSFCNLAFEDVRIFLCNGVTNVEECGVTPYSFKILITCGVSVGSIPSSNVKKTTLSSIS